MHQTLKKGDQGPEVAELQRYLVERGYSVEIDGVFGTKNHKAVRAFQSQHLDPRGQPLVVDGVVGPLTWYSLTNAQPRGPIDFLQMPPEDMGGSVRGRNALAAAIVEMAAGACEIGGNNRGEWVRKYLHGLVEEGNSWCAGFVSWCFSRDTQGTPFRYSVGARDILRQCKSKGWAHAPGEGYMPVPGDIVVWWRVNLAGWQGHVGLVHQVRDGILYTIEGNKSSRVEGFSYVLSRMGQLLGFCHIPDE